MKPETEKVMRSILAGDPSVDEPTVNAAVDILHHRRPDPTRGLVRVLRIKEVAKLLGVVRETVHVYAANGLLEKVMGNGVVPLGISLDSYVRFTEVRSRQITAERDARKPRKPQRIGPSKQELDRESKLRKATWALRQFRNASRHEKYAAVKEYLASHRDVSNTVACEALNLNASCYYHYWMRRPKTVERQKARRDKVVSLIAKLHPNKKVKVAIIPLIQRLKLCRVSIGFESMQKLLEEEHYKWRRCPRRNVEDIDALTGHKTSWYHAEDFVECS